MSRTTPAVEDLRTFVLVARLTSFSRAAAQLGVAPSSISMAISRLEAQLGARLFQRTTRRVMLTQEGVELLARAQRLLEDVDEIASLFLPTDSTLTGRLRVDLPLGMVTGAFMTMLHAFLARHPGLSVDVLSTDRRVDLIADGIDCVVRAGPVGDDTLVCRPLGSVPLVSVASRAYVDLHGEPRAVADLAKHYIVNYTPNPSDQPAGFEYLDGDKTVLLPMRHRVTVNNSAAYRAACQAGFGIVQLPLSGVAADLASGTLVQVLPALAPRPMPINLLYPHRRNLPRRVRVFGDWLAEVVVAAL